MSEGRRLTQTSSNVEEISTGAEESTATPDRRTEERTTTPTNFLGPVSTASPVSPQANLGGPAPRLEPWQPNAELLAAVVSLGFSDVSAEKALFYTGNSSADAAVGWLLDNPRAQDDPTPLSLEGVTAVSAAGRAVERVSSGSEEDEEAVEREERSGASGDMAAAAFKMVLVVNTSLKMGLGKMAAQVGHATLGLYMQLSQSDAFVEPLIWWKESGETKVVLRGEDGQHLEDLRRRSVLAGLGAYLVHDAGRTQIKAGSATVLAIFGNSPKIDEVTGQLKLL